jgi:hypothetical protein
MDAAVRGTDATRRIRGLCESAPAFRASDRERETDTTRWNVDAALAIEVCADDCGEALFAFFSSPLFRRRTRHVSSPRTTSYEPSASNRDGCRKCPKL